MANELEKQFFDTLGIRPREVKICRNTKHCPKKYKLCNDNCKHWQVIRTDYPQITDCILLELICIRNQYLHPLIIFSTKKEFLKNDILEYTIDAINYFHKYEMGKYSKLKHQVRTLFKEG